MLNVFFHHTKKSKQIRGFVKKTGFTTTTWGFTKKIPSNSPVFPSFVFLSPLSTTPHGEAELEQALEAFNLLKVDPLFAMFELLLKNLKQPQKAEKNKNKQHKR